jgi:hypothetical protein
MADQYELSRLTPAYVTESQKLAVCSCMDLVSCLRSDWIQIGRPVVSLNKTNSKLGHGQEQSADPRQARDVLLGTLDVCRDVIAHSGSWHMQAAREHGANKQLAVQIAQKRKN